MPAHVSIRDEQRQRALESRNYRITLLAAHVVLSTPVAFTDRQIGCQQRPDERPTLFAPILRSTPRRIHKARTTSLLHHPAILQQQFLPRGRCCWRGWRRDEALEDRGTERWNHPTCPTSIGAYILSPGLVGNPDKRVGQPDCTAPSPITMTDTIA